MATNLRIASVIGAGVLLALLAAGARAEDAGQKTFEANKCDNCHSIEKLGVTRKIESEKMAGPDLSKVGDKRDAAWITKWCMKEVEENGKKHSSEFKGTKKDLETIANWLATMKTGA
jgi:cytochrome c2